MTDLFSSSTSFDNDSSSSGVTDNELQQFIMVEKQKAQFNAQVKIQKIYMYITSFSHATFQDYYIN